MFVDPVTIAAASPTPALVFSTVKQDGYGSERVDTGGNGYSVIINHTKGKQATRHYVQVIQTKDVTDPYTGAVRKQNAYVSFTISRPLTGWTDVQMDALSALMIDFLEDSEVTTARLLQFQS